VEKGRSRNYSINEKENSSQSNCKNSSKINSGKNIINLTQNVSNINNITNIIIKNPKLEAKNTLINRKTFDCTFAEIKLSNLKENQKILSNDSKIKDCTINIKSSIDEIKPQFDNSENKKKRLSKRNTITDFCIEKKHSNSNNSKYQRLPSIIFEEDNIVPVFDFYDEFNREIIITDYFSRFLALSIAILEDEIYENNFSNNKTKSNSFQALNLNIDLNLSSVLKKELNEEEQMKKKSESELLNVNSDFTDHFHPNKIEKQNAAGDITKNENLLLNKQKEYTEYNKKNIPERFKSQKIGNFFFLNKQ
jgi:hypothetical protein